mmetsp:Transcript_102273/g.284921  ORF Transcript_102273/g.284921 Transcript_102273/m.284921 type:complete len:299 (-) Transcript_102273:316-1212(-)
MSSTLHQERGREAGPKLSYDKPNKRCSVTTLSAGESAQGALSDGERGLLGRPRIRLDHLAQRIQHGELLNLHNFHLGLLAGSSRCGVGAAAGALGDAPGGLAGLAVAGDLARGRDRPAGTGEAREECGDGPNAQPLAELVAEVAAVASQDVVLVHRPILLEVVDEVQHVVLREECLTHVHRLAKNMPRAAPGLAGEDTVALSTGRVAKTPLATVSLHPAMEQAGAQGLEDRVHCLRDSPVPHVVDVQGHHFRCAGPASWQRHCSAHQRPRRACRLALHHPPGRPSPGLVHRQLLLLLV